jgi:hypothetical protein
MHLDNDDKEDEGKSAYARDDDEKGVLIKSHIFIIQTIWGGANTTGFY